MDHLAICLSVCCVRKVYCGEMVEWIRMLLGMVSGVGRGMGVLDEGRDRRTGRGSFGDFATRLFPNYFGQDLFVSLV